MNMPTPSGKKESNGHKAHLPKFQILSGLGHHGW